MTTFFTFCTERYGRVVSFPVVSTQDSMSMPRYFLELDYDRLLARPCLFIIY
jgi:hypothetical protein